jgi:hypothetical protein
VLPPPQGLLGSVSWLSKPREQWNLLSQLKEKSPQRNSSFLFLFISSRSSDFRMILPKNRVLLLSVW